MRPSVPPNKLSAVAFLSTMLPRRCGLATFTADLMKSVQGASPETRCVQVSMTDGSTPGDKSSVFISPQESAGYHRAARALNQADIDLLCIQHEYGIYGGPDGELLLDLLERVEAPVVVTLHTVLDRPSPNQRRVMDSILSHAARVVVMTNHSAKIMRDTHGVTARQLRVVPHGIPSPPAMGRAAGRHMLNVGARPLLLTFGLLSPGKGIEHVIHALPKIVARCPGLLYIVLGVTHPNLLREHGEAYRESLEQLADTLGVRDNVRFLNRFVDMPELTGALAATDIYVTPYVNEAQSVSGTLAYSYGLGTAVVSTPYRHAVELLADGRGSLVPFADPEAIAAAVTGLLADPARLAAIRSAARAAGRDMVWPRVGARYIDIFREAVLAPLALHA